MILCDGAVVSFPVFLKKVIDQIAIGIVNLSVEEDMNQDLFVLKKMLFKLECVIETTKLLQDVEFFGS
jgi:hypothetical protein